MYLNWIGLGLISFVVVYLTYQVWNNTSPPEFNPIRSGLLVAQDVGKTKQIQSKTGDASMATELNRRRAIYTFGYEKPCYIKETKHQKGSTTGALETFFISSLFCPCCVPQDVWYDAGGVDDEFDLVLDDNIYSRGANDAGNQDTEICPPVQ